METLPAPEVPTCFAMMPCTKHVIMVEGIPHDDYFGSEKFLYIRGGHAESEEYTTFGEIDRNKALTSSVHTRFYLVPSKKRGDEELWHIKCSYNNKYLVAKEVKQHGELLVGTADEQNEELSKPSCTLFKLKAGYTTGRVHASFYHPVLDRVCGFLSNEIVRETGEVTENKSTSMYLYDVADQIVLPPYVAFKGDNGLYLRVGDIEGHRYLEFASENKTDTSATFTTLNLPDGLVKIKSELNKMYMGLGGPGEQWILAEDPGYLYCVFRVLKYGDFFALQSHDNGQFCIATKKGNSYCLNAGAKTITDNAKLRLKEPVLTREIYNFEYHRNDHARIYDTADMNMATASAINRTSEKNTVKSSLSITTTESSKYESTITHKANVSVSLSAEISFWKIATEKFQYQVGYEYSNAQTWGNVKQTEKKQEIEYEVTVPANKKVTLTVTAKQAKYDVPFSYIQRDRLPSGETKIYHYDDGLYTGMNCFDLRYETKEEEIETKEEEDESSNKRKMFK